MFKYIPQKLNFNTLYVPVYVISIKMKIYTKPDQKVLGHCSIKIKLQHINLAFNHL